jgi:hypothetical protein
MLHFADETAPKKRRWWRRTCLAGSIGVLTVGGALLARGWLTPGSIPREEIAPGVFLHVDQVSGKQASGAVMVVEMHWDTPGTEIVMRPLDKQLKTSGRHYRLTAASWEVWRNDYVVLLNGTLVTPADVLSSYPGAAVKSNESVVANGEWSHVHAHSYLLWWDAGGNGYVEPTKPPSAASRENAVNGIGVQALQVATGTLQEATLGTESDALRESRSFIGIDPERRILWLIAFEDATLRYAAGFTAKLGVPFAGQLDSGSATTMIIGPGADEITPFTGIRNSRLLGGYIAIRRTVRE